MPRRSAGSRWASPGGRLRMLCAAGGALALALLFAFSPWRDADVADPAGRAAAEPGAARAAAQVRVGDAMSRLSGRVAAAWVERRSTSGLFVDPITGGAGHGYGPAMLAEVLIREGARREDRRMLGAGLRALAENSRRAADDGVPGNPLELLGIASAYRWAEDNLGGSRRMARALRAPRDYLRAWESGDVGRGAQRCFASPSCWNNYKVVDAAAVLLLLDTGLEPASPSSRLADPEGARRAAVRILEHDLPRALGGSASARGAEGQLGGLGLLADQPTYPLAYHALSAAALARALDVLGDRAPAAARDAFRRAMLAQAAFMGPDGDIAYFGRAQGESWALAATAYAGEWCAARFAASHPRSAGMCATLAIRAVRRLETLHGFRDGVLAIVPRFSGTPLTAEGLERYARVMTFNGLTAAFLAWGSDEARRARHVPPAALPLDRGGSFVDPDASRLAVVRRGPVWLAVHATGTLGANDLRYDFGVAALKYRRGGRWVDVVPQRPFVDPGMVFDGAGPLLVTPSGNAHPRGRRFSVDPDSGEVVVRGGYRTVTGTWALRGATFRFTPSHRGVVITAEAPAGSTLRFEDYLPAAWTRVEPGTSALSTPTATSRLFPAPFALEPGLTLTSANSFGLQGYRRHVTVPATGRVRWAIAARARPDRAFAGP